MPNLSGKWVISKHDPLDAILNKLSIPADKRPPQPITNFTVEIKQVGDNVEMKSTGNRGSRETKFVVGTTFETELLMGTITIKVTASWEGNKMLLITDKGAKLYREVVGDQLISTLVLGDETAKVYFNKAG